jgi:hypothetical protein
MNPLVLIAVGVGVYFFIKSKSSTPNGTMINLNQEKTALINWINSGGDSETTKANFANMVNNIMTASEIDALYVYVFEYAQKGLQVPQGDPLYYQIQTISHKYNIFS